MTKHYVKRFLNLDLPEGQSCFLWGARKTGKSTFLKEKYPNARWIDFLHGETFKNYFLEPWKLRKELEKIKNPPLVIIDEFQRVPELLNEIHWLIENKRVQFILCGSSARRLRFPGVNLLGGRAWRYMFMPFCYAELKELNWEKIFNNGLLPDHYFSKNPGEEISSYLFDYVLNEVYVEAKIRQKDPFAKFIDILGFCNGEMINYTNIARECGVSYHTVQSYFEILEDMYLGYIVRPYREKARRQIVQDIPKFYLFDTGIASYLKKFHFTEMRGPDAGHSFEHYVLLELMAYKSLTKKRRDDIFYWRTREGYEVDFIVQNMAIEVKMSSRIDSRDLKNLLVFSENEEKSLHVVCLEPNKMIREVNGKEIHIWPIEDFLKALWNGELWI
jgi:hypothetical protein